MNQYTNIVLLNSSNIIDVVRRSLGKIDPRLVNHGERVGYIVKKLYDVSDDKSNINFSKLFILCLLHDIGAYKTNEIDDMVRFETEKPYDHSLFGYLFLKNTTHLAKYAEALLYHHTPYSQLKNYNFTYAKYAELIFLADRADILIHSDNPDLLLFRSMAGSYFNPEYVELLFKAEEKYGISHKLLSGEYQDETYNILKTLDIKNNEIMEYLKLLIYAIDFRSPYTVTHTADTVIISTAIGKLLGLYETELQKLYIGAFLHDIGKIAISYDILEKPSRLSAEEFEIVKGHITEGEEILKGVVNDEICNIALRHHEKLNGSGYIHGLTASSLTRSERIVAVADIMSALSQERSYKKPFPKEKVISILNEMKSAGQLCPTVVDTVCSNYDMILKNTEKSHDPVKVMYQNLLYEYSEFSAEGVTL